MLNRSHPQILALPNRLFYDGELQAMADRELVNNMLRWEHLPQVCSCLLSLCSWWHSTSHVAAAVPLRDASGCANPKFVVTWDCHTF